MACILSRTTLSQAVHKNIIFGPIVKTMFMKNDEIIINRINPRVERNLRLRDNISNDYRLVYKEDKIIITTTSVGYYFGWVNLSVSAILFAYIMYENPPIPEELGDKPLFNTLTKTSRMIMVLVYLSTCILTIAITKIIPFRIYHNSTQKLFKAIFTRNLLGKQKILTYAEGTATSRFRSIMTNALLNINGHIVLLEKEYFVKPHIYQQMLRQVD